MSYLSQKCKTIGLTDIVWEIKRVKKLPWFWKIEALKVIQRSPQEFIVKNIGESTEANDHIL